MQKKTFLLTSLLATIICVSVTTIPFVRKANAQPSFPNHLCNLAGNLGCTFTCGALATACGPGAPICAAVAGGVCVAACGVGINEVCSHTDPPSNNNAGTNPNQQQQDPAQGPCSLFSVDPCGDHNQPQQNTNCPANTSCDSNQPQQNTNNGDGNSGGGDSDGMMKI